MKLALGLLAASLYAQTLPPIWPSAVATNNNLLVAGNGATATLAAPITTTTGLSFTITSPTSFAANMVVQVDNEQMLICTYSYPTVTICSGGRGFGGTTAATHLVTHVVANYVFSQYHNGLSTELQAVESWLNGYTPPNATTALPLVDQLLAQIQNDPRNWGAVGVVAPTTGGCSSSTVDDEPGIQLANTAAMIYGPPDVYLPIGYCWPIQTHIWVPPGIRFHSIGRTSGYEQSSPTGAVLIANANWAATNTSFPYSQMVWVAGSNQTSGTYEASGATFGTEVDHLEINCNDQVGCGNLFAVGRQEKSSFHDLLLTGSVPFSGGYSHGWYEQGVDCFGGSPPAAGCLVNTISGSNPFTGPAGPDFNIEVFPSYNNCQTNFIPISLQGMNNYKGLSSVTVAGYCGGLPYAGYVWGSTFSMGAGGIMHDQQTNNGWYIGNDPMGSTCVGANDALFENFEHALTIASCASQQALTFVNDAGGVINNQNSTTVSQTNYYFNSGPPTIFGWPGIEGPATSASVFKIIDPGDFEMNGHNGINLWNGNTHSGVMMQPLLDTGSTYVRGDVCSDAWWNTNTQLWNIGPNGSGDYECTLFGGGWYGIVAAQGTVNTTISQATMNGKVAMATNTSGHTFFGQGVINSAGSISPADDGNIVQVQGGISIGSATVRASWTTSAGAPSGSCAKGSMDSDTTNGHLWFCTSSGWTQVTIP